MLQMAIIFAAAAFFITLERLRPGRELPMPAGWWFRAAALNVAQLAIVIVAGLTWNRWFAGVSVARMSEHVVPVAEGAIAWFIGTFVFYWWHRARHASDWLWRVFHQVHHSPARIEAITSFYKHPLEIAANSLLSGLIIFILLGGSVEGAAWFNVFAATGEMFYHANIRTPRWFGWFLQRPEHHSIHHQTGVHDFNYGDITWWDRLFGTFREAPQFSRSCGFGGDGERKLGQMLAFRVNGDA